MEKKTYFLYLLIAVIAFTFATLSGAVNWVFQFVVTGLAYFAAGFLLGRRQHSTRLLAFALLFTLLPYMTLYVSMSIRGHSIQTYPIWIVGIAGCLVGALVGLKLQSRRTLAIAMITYFAIIVPGGAFFMIHWLGYVFRPVDSRVDQTIDYRLSTFEGGWVTSEDMKGKVVALNFWSTSCGACVKEFPGFNDFYNRHKTESDVVIYAVNIPLEGESREDIRRMVKENGYTFPTLFTSSDIQVVKTEFGIQGIPTVLVLDETGLVRYSGPFITSKYDLINQIDLRLQQAKQRMHSTSTHTE